MKKRFLIPLIGTYLVACTNDEFQSFIDGDLENIHVEELRTELEVIEIATQALNEFFPVTSRSSIDLSNIDVVFIGDLKTRSENITNPLYIVNFGDDKGYAIISANKDVEPLLAITESGSITDINSINNPGLELFVNEALKLEKDTTRLDPIPPLPGTGDDGPVLATDVRTDTLFRFNKYLAPQIKVQWGQKYPEGILCPNGYSGCVATAAAQALSYFEYPEMMNLTFPNHTTDQIALNWYEMKNYIYSNSFWLFQGPYNLQLASLCREIGHRINADYSNPDGTRAKLSNLRSYMKALLPSDRFGVSGIHVSAPTSPSFSESGVMVIAAAEAGASIGHAWVIDGYIFKDYTVYVYFKYFDSPIEYLERQFDKRELYFHCNWGWCGSDNGFFRYDLFKTSYYYFEEKFQYFTIESK